MISGQAAIMEYIKRRMDHPGDCAWCRSRQRGGNLVHYKDGKVYCPHHGMDTQLSAEEMIIPYSNPYR